MLVGAGKGALVYRREEVWPLLNKIKDDYFSWLVLFSILLLLLEVLFFNKGLIFSLLLAAGMVYYGRKRIEQNRKRGKFYFGVELFFSS